MSALDQSGIDALVKRRNEGWNEELRYSYPLTPESVVWDVGAWRGEWAQEIHRRFGCTVHSFEIIPRMQDLIEEHYEGNPKLFAHRYGLGAHTEVLDVVDASECTSTLISGPTRMVIQRASTTLRDPIDLLKINVEGAEYDMLDDMLDTGQLGLAQYLQIQFHDYIQLNGVYLEVPDAHRRYDDLTPRLAEHFERTWIFPWVWESWKRR